MKLIALLILTTTLFAAEQQRERPEQISREQFLVKAAERFDRMDTNSDGILSREERQVARREHGQRVNERRQEHREN